MGWRDAPVSSGGSWKDAPIVGEMLASPTEPTSSIGGAIGSGIAQGVALPFGPLASYASGKIGQKIGGKPLQAIDVAAEALPAAGAIGLPGAAALATGGLSTPVTLALGTGGVMLGEKGRQIVRGLRGKEAAPPIQPIPFSNYELPRIPGVSPGTSNIIQQGALNLAPEALIGGVKGAASVLDTASTGLARRALGFQKSQLFSTKSFRESLRKMAYANRSAKEMLQKDVIPLFGSPQKMARNAMKLMDETGSTMNTVLAHADEVGLKVNPDNIGIKLIDEIKPKYADQNKITEAILGDLEVLRQNPTLKEAAELKTRWAKIGFEDKTVGTEGSKIYRKASRILDNYVGDTLARANDELGTAYREAKRVYGSAYNAMRGISNKLAIESGNMMFSLPSIVAGGGALATGNVPGALATLGIFEGIKRRGASTMANAVYEAGKAAMTAKKIPAGVPGPVFTALRSKRENQ